MVTTYDLRELKSHKTLTHSGEMEIRNFSLLIDGREFQKFSDRCEKTGYKIGKGLDIAIRDRIDFLQSFFPGTLIKSKVKSAQ